MSLRNFPVRSGGGGGTTDVIAQAGVAANDADIAALQASQAAQDALIAAVPTQAQVDALQAVQDAEDPYSTFTRQPDGSIDWTRASGAAGSIAAPASVDPATTVPPAANDAVGLAGVSTEYARADHKHPQEAAFTWATATVAGTQGDVPLPAAGDEAKVLHGDGTWQTIAGNEHDSGNTLPVASADGPEVFDIISDGGLFGGRFLRIDDGAGTYAWKQTAPAETVTVTPTEFRIDLQTKTQTSSPMISYAGNAADITWEVRDAGDAILQTTNGLTASYDIAGQAGLYWLMRVADTTLITQLDWGGIQAQGAVPDISGLSALTRVILSGNLFDGGFGVFPTSLTTLEFTNLRTAVVDFAYLVNLTDLQMRRSAGAQTSSLLVADGPAWTNFDLRGHVLDQASVDHILTVADNGGASNGTINLSGGTSAAANAGTATAALASLQGKGWTITE